jgi:hypothetical protein
VKTLVGFEIFVDFVRFVEQFFVSLISLRSLFHRQKIVRKIEQNRQKFQSQLPKKKFWDIFSDNLGYYPKIKIY